MGDIKKDGSIRYYLRVIAETLVNIDTQLAEIKETDAAICDLQESYIIPMFCGGDDEE